MSKKNDLFDIKCWSCGKNHPIYSSCNPCSTKKATQETALALRDMSDRMDRYSAPDMYIDLGGLEELAEQQNDYLDCICHNLSVSIDDMNEGFENVIQNLDSLREWGEEQATDVKRKMNKVRRVMVASLLCFDAHMTNIHQEMQSFRQDFNDRSREAIAVIERLTKACEGINFALRNPRRVKCEEAVTIALHLVKSDSFHKAETEVERAIEVFPIDPRLYILRAGIFKHWGKYDLAIEAYKEAVKLIHVEDGSKLPEHSLELKLIALEETIETCLLAKNYSKGSIFFSQLSGSLKRPPTDQEKIMQIRLYAGSNQSAMAILMAKRFLSSVLKKSSEGNEDFGIHDKTIVNTLDSLFSIPEMEMCPSSKVLLGFWRLQYLLIKDLLDKKQLQEACYEVLENFNQFITNDSQKFAMVKFTLKEHEELKKEISGVLRRYNYDLADPKLVDQINKIWLKLKAISEKLECKRNDLKVFLDHLNELVKRTGYEQIFVTPGDYLANCHKEYSEFTNQIGLDEFLSFVDKVKTAIQVYVEKKFHLIVWLS